MRIVLDGEGPHGSRWQAIVSIAAKIGCSADTLNDWVKKAEVDSGRRAGVSTDMAAKLKALERENRELRQANEILRKASAYFALAELRLMEFRAPEAKGSRCPAPQTAGQRRGWRRAELGLAGPRSSLTSPRLF